MESETEWQSGIQERVAQGMLCLCEQEYQANQEYSCGNQSHRCGGMSLTSPTLIRQAKRWASAEKKDRLPDELYEALASGRGKAYERRVIRNLAKHSRIVDVESASIRPYEEFSKDWKYTKSVFGRTMKCGLCGHAPLKENCVLINEESGEELLVGNTCVHRYIEIRNPETGELMSDDEKMALLKGNMTEAKKEYAKQEFAQAYPDAMNLLKKYERMMHSRKPLKRLHKTVVNRLVKYGYLGGKTRKTWDTFMETAEAEHQAYEEYKRQQAIESRARAERNAEAKAKFAQQIAQNRNTWATEADDFIAVGSDLEDKLNSWEKEMVGRVQSKIRQTGVKALRGGYLRFYEETQARHMIENGVEIPMPPLGTEVKLWLQSAPLNDWEKEFCTSIMGRLALGRSLSEGQINVIEKIRKKVSK